MKRSIALIVGALFIASAAFAEGYVSANDLEKGTFTSTVKLEDGFELHGTAEKAIVVDAQENALTASDGEIFTQRINTKGVGNTSQRSVSFPVKAGETVTLYGHSSSKTDTRTMLVVDADGNTVFSLDVGPAATEAIAIGSFKAPASGTLYAWSKSGGIYIYSIKVTK